MRALTNDQCDEWLRARSLPPKPYNSPDSRPPFCAQFPLPHDASKVSALFRSICHALDPFQEALLHVTDWSLYEPDQMAVLAAIRHGLGESRPLIEAPGHLFTMAERDLLTGLLSLLTNYGWTAYVYFDHGLTLLSWEGDLLDVFSSNPKHHSTVCDIAQYISLSSSSSR